MKQWYAHYKKYVKIGFGTQLYNVAVILSVVLWDYVINYFYFVIGSAALEISFDCPNGK